MAIIEIVFSDSTKDFRYDYSGNDEYPLFFNVSSIRAARRWLELLRIEVSKSAKIERHYLKSEKVNGRFVGFPGFKRDSNDLCELINGCINIINNYSEGAIPIRATNDASQKDLNELHKYFEVLRGPRLSPAPMFLEGDDTVRTALEDFNLLIHEYEAFNASRSLDGSVNASIDITFEKNWTREPISELDYKYFNPTREFGGVYLHYCDVGKPLLDAFHDNDEFVGTGNIRPLEFISADFDIFFGKSNKYIFDLDFKVRFNSWLKSVGLEPSDPRLCIGYIKVGQLIRDTRIRYKEAPEIFEILSNRMNIKRIAIHD